MRLEHESQKFLEKEIVKTLGRYLDLDTYEIFFFGSRVTGKGDERSDIDIGIEGARPLPLDKLSAIREALAEIPVLYRLDLVDFSGTTEAFKEVAKQKIELISHAA